MIKLFSLLLVFTGGIFLATSIFGNNLNAIRTAINNKLAKLKPVTAIFAQGALVVGSIGVFIILSVLVGPVRDDQAVMNKFDLRQQWLWHQDFKSYQIFLSESGIAFWLWRVAIGSFFGIFIGMLLLGISERIPILLKKTTVRLVCGVLGVGCFIVDAFFLHI